MSEAQQAQQRRAILLLSVAAFASGTSARLCDPLLPELSRAFDASASEVAHVVSGFAIAYGLVQAFFGPIGDRLGKYRLIALTTLASVLGTLGCVVAVSLDQLIVARFVTGITAAGIIPLSMAWIGDTVPYEERQSTLARFLGGQILGVIGGQFIGGAFADTLGWRWAFAFLSLTYLLVGLAVWRESQRNPLTFHQHTHETRNAKLGAQVALVLSAPWARVILMVVFLEGFLIFGAMAFIPLYLHNRFSLSMSAAGALMGFFGIGGLAYISAAKHFVRRLGEVGLALSGTVAVALAWLLISMLGFWAVIIPAAFLLGIGYYMLHNTLQTNATQMAPQVRGTAVSLFASAFFLGQSAGVSTGATVFERWGGGSLFDLAGILMVPLGLGFAFLLRQRMERSRNTV